MSRHATTLPRSTWWLLAMLSLGWGLNWPMIKLSIVDIPVWTFRAICVMVGGVGMFALARLNGQSLRVRAGEWWPLIAMALFNVTLWNIFVTYGVKTLPAGRSAILAYTMPLWTVVLSAFVLGEKLTRRRVAGLALGMSGLLLLLGDSLVAIGGAPLGAVSIAVAAFSWAVGTVLMKRVPLSLGTTAFTGWSFILGGVPLVVGAVAIEHSEWRPIGTPSMIGLVYNIFVAFLLCHWLWFRLVTLAPAGALALGTLAIPVIGVFSGMLVLGERPGWTEFGALGLVLSALATVLIPPRRAITQVAGADGR